MSKTKITKFPDGFFNKQRPIISTEEALKDTDPFKPSNEVLKGDKKIVLCSTREKNLYTKKINHCD